MLSFLFLTLLPTISLVVYLWLYTDFAGYYIKLLKPILNNKIYSWLMAEEYLSFYDENISFDSYIEYLFFQKQGQSGAISDFVLKLLSCQICLVTWISIIYCLLCGRIEYTGLVFLAISANIFILKYFLKSH